MNLLKAVNNGRRGAETIQQPSPVFFTPEREREMTVGYKYEMPEKQDDKKLVDKLRQTITEIHQTKDRLKSVLEAREAELEHTQMQLRECVKELCEMCGDDLYPENGTCKACKWQKVRRDLES